MGSMGTVVSAGRAKTEEGKQHEKEEVKEENFGESKSDSMFMATIAQTIASHPNATSKCNGNIDSVWYNSALSAAKAKAMSRMVPQASRERYEKHYNGFVEWCDAHGVVVSRVVVTDILAWLEIKAKDYKLSSLWSMLSAVKCMLLFHHHIETSNWKVHIAKYMR